MPHQSSTALPGSLPVPIHSSLRLALTPPQLGENLHLPEFGLCWKTHADPTQSHHRHGQHSWKYLQETGSTSPDKGPKDAHVTLLKKILYFFKRQEKGAWTNSPGRNYAITL